MGNKTISQGAALFFLALWHGTESGYFMFFYLEFIGLNAESLVCIDLIARLITSHANKDKHNGRRHGVALY